jgi:hypothetical protein
MKPFDLPPGNVPDALCADPCRPAEVREHESYLSNRADDEDREHVDRIEQQPQRPEPLPPGRGFISQPLRHPQPRVDGSFIFGVPTPLRARSTLPPE